MPLPWKKTKPNRISRIVADLQPPSRAASLVVETGFPTSVVDLFVKNRNRIKRHSLNKSKHKHSPLHSSESMAPPPPTPDDSPLLPAVATAAVHGLDDLLKNSAAATDVESNVVDNANAIAIANEDSSVFDLTAKMLLAVVPVLSSTKLAVWIVLFAFLLEILGQIVPRFFDLSSIQNRLLSKTNADAEQEIPPIISDEIEIMESNSDYEQLVLSESFREIEIGCSSSSLGMKMEEERKLEMEKNERSRSSKLRAKIMKKLIPKKLRSGKKKGKRNKMKELEEGSTTITENELSCEEEQEEHEVLEFEEEGIESSTMGKGEEQEQDQDQRKMNLDSKIMIMMILLGLCVNRFLALVLAVSGCFMFKFIKSLDPNMEIWVKAHNSSSDLGL